MVDKTRATRRSAPHRARARVVGHSAGDYNPAMKCFDAIGTVYVVFRERHRYAVYSNTLFKLCRFCPERLQLASYGEDVNCARQYPYDLLVEFVDGKWFPKKTAPQCAE